MSWLGSLRIKYKILIVALVGTIGFLVFLGLIVNSGNQNNLRLEQVRSVHFPMLEMANTNIVLLDRANELMGNAASTGEQEMLKLARKSVADLNANLDRQRMLNPEFGNEIDMVGRAVNEYADKSVALTSSMMDGTVHTATAERTDIYVAVGDAFRAVWKQNTQRLPVMRPRLLAFA